MEAFKTANFNMFEDHETLTLREINDVHNYYQAKGKHGVARCINKEYIQPMMNEGKQTALVPSMDLIVNTRLSADFNEHWLENRRR